MSIDYTLLQAEQYFINRTPFLIFKPDFNSFDQTVPLLCLRNKTKIIKAAMHDLGRIVPEKDAFSFVKQVLDYPIKEDTAFWVEDISTLDDKPAFIAHVIEAARRNTYFRVVFTAIERHCPRSLLTIPFVSWDPDYSISIPDHIYFHPVKSHSEFTVPQALHFRVYCNIISEIIQTLKYIPDATLEVDGGKIASLNSIIKCAALAIQPNTVVRLTTHENFATHKLLTDAIISGWSKQVRPLFGDGFNEKNS